MKLVVDKFMHESPGLSVIPETEYEAAVLARYWKTAVLSTGCASPHAESANGHCYTVKFVEPSAAEGGKR